MTWTVVSRSQDALIELEAIKLAEIVAGQAGAARSAYSRLAVSKLKNDGFGASESSDDLKGHIPLPAQFLRELSKRSQTAPGSVFSFKPVSKWNLAADQGISDDFLKWAWAKLEVQDANKPEGPLDWDPVWRIEQKEGQQTLRYLKSDPAAAASCVSCHNALEMRPDVIASRIRAGVEPGKQWRLNDLLGAIEISIPLDQAVTLAKAQSQQGLFTVLGVSVIGLIGLLLLVFIDSARNRAMTTELAYQARHDSLTGLPNRFHLELEMKKRLEVKNSFTILILDLDNFKQVNDTLGHDAGDSVLCESAVRLTGAVGETGLVARLGGDEFAVILHDANRERAERVASDISQAINKTYEINVYGVALGVSIGIALYPEHGEELSELLRCADVAMYLAKNSGVASSFYDSNRDDNKVATLLMNNELRAAIADGELDVFFQPKYSLKTGQMTGVEALARWNSPEHGPIPPSVFVPKAESLGLINDLTAMILDRSLRECQSWRENGYDLSVSVNLSTLSLQDMRIVDLVVEKLADTGIAPEALILEVTEGAVMADVEQAIVVLEAMKALGARISVDDYGTGYCSLSYLTTLPISELKLDRSFIQRVLENDKDALVVKATLDLTRSLSLTMVAEGVEDAPTLDVLCQMGVDVVQGYFLCRPISAIEFCKRLPYIHRFNPSAAHEVNSSANWPADLDKAA